MRAFGLVSAFLAGANAFKQQDCNANYTLEFVQAQDNSGSFSNDLIQMRALFPDLLKDLALYFPGAKFGLTTFRDKPVGGLGRPSDYCWRLESSLQEDQNAFLNSLNRLTAGGGFDDPESQLDALLFTARQIPEMNWSTTEFDDQGRPILRIICLSTDQTYHVAGDGYNAGKLPPCDGTGYAECKEQDYPTIDQISEALKVVPNMNLLFLTVNRREDLYTDLLEELDVPGSVQNIADDSSNIIEAILEGLEEIICPSTTPEPSTPTSTASTTASTKPTTPPGGGGGSTPPGGGAPTTPPGGGAPTTPPGGGAPTTPPGGGAPTTPPGGGAPTTPPGGGPPTTPPGGGAPTTPPGGGAPTTPPGGGAPTTPPGGGAPTTPPGGGAPTTPPGGGAPTTPPGGGAPTTPPGGGGGGTTSTTPIHGVGGGAGAAVIVGSALAGAALVAAGGIYAAHAYGMLGSEHAVLETIEGGGEVMAEMEPVEREMVADVPMGYFA